MEQEAAAAEDEQEAAAAEEEKDYELLPGGCCEDEPETETESGSGSSSSSGSSGIILCLKTYSDKAPLIPDALPGFIHTLSGGQDEVCAGIRSVVRE